MSAATQPLVPVLDDNAVYLGDNGRAFCGACAGQSARFTGRDISGQQVCRISADEAAAVFTEYGAQIRCEHCSKEPTSS